jgi:diaminopimelate decarboxylase
MTFVDGLVPPPRLRTYDLGGGFGIDYGDGRGRLDVDALAAELAPRIRARGLTPILEPGRWIVADAGVLLTRVLGTKERPSHRFVLVDAAMTELIRPALYQASHGIAPIRAPERAPDGVWDVVGPVCESGDFLGRSRALPRLVPGELLASGYNSRPRAAEVLVDGQDARLVRRRERVEDLWAEELFP